VDDVLFPLFVSSDIHYGTFVGRSGVCVRYRVCFSCDKGQGFFDCFNLIVVDIYPVIT